MNSLLKKLVGFSIGTYVNIFVILIIMPIVSRMLSPNDFAKYGFFKLMISIFTGVAYFGIDGAYIRFFNVENKESRSKLFKICLMMSLLIFIILLLPFLYFWKNISLFLFDSLYPDTILLCIVASILVLLHHFLIITLQLMLSAKQYSISNIVLKLSELALILLFYLTIKDYNFKFLTYSYIFSFFITIIIMAYFLKNFLFLKTKKQIIKTPIKDIINISYPVAVTIIITFVFQATDRFLLKKYNVPMAEIGIYSSAFQISSILTLLFNPFLAFFRSISNKKFVGNIDSNKPFFKSIIQTIIIVSFTLACAVMITKNLIIYILLDSKYFNATSIVPLLLFIPIMYTISETTKVGINFTKKTYYGLIVSVIAVIVNIIGNIILIPIYGSWGAGLSTAISYIIFCLLRTFISRKLLYIDYSIIKLMFLSILFLAYTIISSIYNSYSITIIGAILFLIILYASYYSFIKTNYLMIKQYLKPKKNI